MIILPKTIKMVITDFDGVITDNCVYVNSQGEMTRKLNFKDIMGVSILKKSGIMIGIVSGEQNSAINLLNEKFGLEEVHQGIRNKLEVIASIVQKYSLSEDEFVYIGDDINDFDTLACTKYAITVPSAIRQVKAIPHIQITENDGGNGAFREVVDSLVG